MKNTGHEEHLILDIQVYFPYNKKNRSSGKNKGKKDDFNSVKLHYHNSRNKIHQ